MKLTIAILAILLLAGCGGAVNNQLMSAHDTASVAWVEVEKERASAMKSAITGCGTDPRCIENVNNDFLVMTLTGSSRQPQLPRLRSAAEDVRDVGGVIVGGLNAAGNIGLGIVSVLESNKTARFTQARQSETLLGVNQSNNNLSGVIAGGYNGITTELLGFLGDQPPQTQYGDGTIINNGTLVDDNSQIGNTENRRDTADDGGIIGSENRQTSPGPFENVGNNPEPPPDDGLPPGVFPLPTVGPGGG